MYRFVPLKLFYNCTVSQTTIFTFYSHIKLKWVVKFCNFEVYKSIDPLFKEQFSYIKMYISPSHLIYAITK